MGYTTEFSGELIFTPELTGKQLAKIKSFFGEDCREHSDWYADGSYIDLEFNEDFSGIQWDSATEKNNGMVSHINLIMTEMRKEIPEFSLSGTMIAQGESLEDRWLIKIENGIAIKKEIEIKGTKTTCPHCGEDFIIEIAD